MNEVKRPSLREAARRGVEANRQAKQAAPPPKPTPAPVPAAPPPPPAKPVEAVTPTEKQTQAKQPRREKPRPHIARLPHGATFLLRFDAEAVRWAGTLTIPAPGSGIFKESVVSADDGAVFALLQRLDRKLQGHGRGAADRDDGGCFDATVTLRRGRRRYFLLAWGTL